MPQAREGGFFSWCCPGKGVVESASSYSPWHVADRAHSSEEYPNCCLRAVLPWSACCLRAGPAPRFPVGFPPLRPRLLASMRALSSPEATAGSPPRPPPGWLHLRSGMAGSGARPKGARGRRHAASPVSPSNWATRWSSDLRCWRATPRDASRGFPASRRPAPASRVPRSAPPSSAKVLKLAVGRARPASAPGDPGDFRPFGRLDASFPSVHTTVAFAAASAIHSEARARWVPWVVYPAAAAVGGRACARTTTG